MTTASELIRLLLFPGYSEVTDFLKNSPLNRYLYKLLLKLLPKHGIEVPIVKLFNEIYFQCIHINYDATPGEKINERYLSESGEWLQSQPAARLVFSIVWALLCDKKSYTFEEDCFLGQLATDIKNSEFYDLASFLPNELRKLKISVPDSFPPMPCPVDGLPEFLAGKERRSSLSGIIRALVEEEDDYEMQLKEFEEYSKAWSTVTCNYSHSLIEKFVRLYPYSDDQLELVSRIQTSCSREQLNNNICYFTELSGKIITGNFELDEPVVITHNPQSFNPADCQDDLLSANSKNADDLDNVKKLKDERDSLKKQLDELQKKHQLELAKMEAKYQVELSKKKDNDEQTSKEHAQGSHDDIKEDEPGKKEFSLTVTEIARQVKERFSKEGALEVSTMLYHLAVERGCLEEELFKMIDGILPAVLKREPIHQTFNMPNVEQFNNNPQTVNNYNKESPKE